MHRSERVFQPKAKHAPAPAASGDHAEGAQGSEPDAGADVHEPAGAPEMETDAADEHEVPVAANTEEDVLMGEALPEDANDATGDANAEAGRAVDTPIDEGAEIMVYVLLSLSKKMLMSRLERG